MGIVISDLEMRRELPFMGARQFLTLAFFVPNLVKSAFEFEDTGYRV